MIIADDDPAVLHALRFAFEIEGFDVMSFPDAASVLRSPPLPKCGCLVLDYKMPDMDGLTLLAALRAAGVELPAILMTSGPTRALKARAAAAHVPIVEKPLLGDELTRRVRGLTGAQVC
ncbi:response regulator [Caulobacter sp. NIBR2454]|uniref:response regulator n=1 Tax=Caulobacter sp. NIBR2454 TaxID=3015996 RepID=UPI0022B603B9|nr:response regulator [Caulobacter sp. NIBR2454]